MPSRDNSGLDRSHPFDVRERPGHVDLHTPKVPYGGSKWRWADLNRVWPDTGPTGIVQGREPDSYTCPMAELDAVEARIWTLLDPYKGELEEATIYGMPSLRWPGSGSHDYFAAVKRSAHKVSLYAVAVDTWPETLEGSSERFRSLRTGKATFSFPSLDAELAAELETFLGRLYQQYRKHHASVLP